MPLRTPKNTERRISLVVKTETYRAIRSFSSHHHVSYADALAFMAIEAARAKNGRPLNPSGAADYLARPSDTVLLKGPGKNLYDSIRRARSKRRLSVLVDSLIYDKLSVVALLRGVKVDAVVQQELLASPRLFPDE